MRKIIPVVVAGATAVAVAGGTFAYASLDKDVTLAVDGADSQVSTMGGTVADVLAQQGVTVGEHDLVAPGLESSVVDGTRIAVSYGRQVTVNVDGTPKTFWTTATTVDDALSSLGVDTAGAELTTSRSAPIGRQGLTFDLGTQKSVTVTVAGKKRSLETTGVTVADVLADAKIAVDGDDKVSRAATAKIAEGASITVIKVDVATVKKKSDVAFRTVYKNSDKLDQGQTKVEQSGKTGTRTRTYRETRHDGDVVKRTTLDSAVTTKPRTKIVVRGTRIAGAGDVPSGNTVWDRLAQCESGGNWQINTGNGFSGGLQFLTSTWRAMGGSGEPWQHSREEQIAVAKRLQARAGWGQWPGCSAKLGLR